MSSTKIIARLSSGLLAELVARAGTVQDTVGMAYEPAAAWSQLASSYEAARGREDSLDRLLDWPCQRELIGNIVGKSILDLGCGSGAKAIQLANEGARRVLGIDISRPFIEALQSQPTPPGTSWIQADIEQLGEVTELAEQRST